MDLLRRSGGKRTSEGKFGFQGPVRQPKTRSLEHWIDPAGRAASIRSRQGYAYACLHLLHWANARRATNHQAQPPQAAGGSMTFRRCTIFEILKKKARPSGRAFF